MDSMLEKSRLIDLKERLEEILFELKKVAVAYSGGVDSTFLLAVARHVLGEKVLAITAVSPLFPEEETKRAVRLAKEMDVPILTIMMNQLTIPDFVANRSDRCYICKKALMRVFRERISDIGIENLLHGENIDDLKDYRPGSIAAEEAGALAPLVEAGLGKWAIRTLSKEMGLTTWDLPSMACLASRIPFRMPISEIVLQQIAQAEQCLHDLGFSICRVRHHGDTARIEVDPAQIARLATSEVREIILEKLQKIGFSFIAIDIQGYRTGSMNPKVTETAW